MHFWPTALKLDCATNFDTLFLVMVFTCLCGYFVCIWPTALKLGCITNLDMLFLMMGFICWVDEINFMLIIVNYGDFE